MATTSQDDPATESGQPSCNDPTKVQSANLCYPVWSWQAPESSPILALCSHRRPSLSIPSESR